MSKPSIQNKISKILPDNRPITAIQVIEDLQKCPRGFYPITRTYDQDQDADLRESSIFKSSSARYLCLSKTEGLPNFVLQALFVLPEKFIPPRGYSLLTRTADTEQRAWKKKQLGYRLVNLKDTTAAITDIIICSRLKKAPTGFTFAGELNGVTLCYKMGNVQDTQSGTTPNVTVSPTPMYPPLNNDADHDYEILLPGYNPTRGGLRPAPKPPVPTPAEDDAPISSIATASHHGMEDVPFMLNPKFAFNLTDDTNLPVIKSRTIDDILRDYDYPFTLERQT